MDDALTELATRLRSSVARLQRRLRASASGPTSPAAMSILGLLDKHESLSLGELANLELVRPPTITPVVRSLEAQGFLTRVPDPSDRRSIRVRLTPAGRRELEANRRRRTQFLEQRLLRLSPAERARALELVRFLESLTEES
jgi:DNA-binding MarR family transcriptional regulator